MGLIRRKFFRIGALGHHGEQPVAGRAARHVLTHRRHHAGGVAARHERPVGFDLIDALDHQPVGEIQPNCGHIYQDLARPRRRIGELFDLVAVDRPEVADHHGSHDANSLIDLYQ